MSETPRIPAPKLRAACVGVLEAIGCSPAEAATIVEHLLTADLSGHASHGVGLLPQYVAHFNKGLVKPNQTLKPVNDAGAILQFDGQNGFGAVMGRDATSAAIARAKQLGLCAYTLGNSHHIGRIGGFGEQAAAAGFVFIGFVNVTDHDPLVAPHRGAEARFGTNPVCITLPATASSPVFLLDMATSKIALGKVRVAALKGEQVPEGALLDEHGKPTTTPPNVAVDGFKGALTFMGDHKGYILGFACELLAGALSGFGTIQPENPRRYSIQNRMFAIVLDPAKFGERGFIDHEIDAMRAYVLAARPIEPGEPVLFPGDPERAARAECARSGVPLERPSVEAIARVAQELGVTTDLI
jgi:LDH2 family malate/lactate/ureidoglycolate dehydrogenase